MPDIETYQYDGKPAYKGTAKCSICGSDYFLNTTDKSIFKTGRCFSCFMQNKTVPEIKEQVGFIHFNKET